MPLKYTILYVEDDADDLFMVKHAFEKFNGSIEIVHAQDGFEALEYLNRAYHNGHLPCLVILDINMPGMDGREALIRIKQTSHYSSIPVVLFTTSSSEFDKSFASKWGAALITKPLVFPDLEKLAANFASMCDVRIVHE